MRSVIVTLVALAPIALCVACGGGDGDAPNVDAGDSGPDGGPTLSTDDFMNGLPASCAFDCVKGCPDESVGPFACPSMKSWAALPHEDVCGNVDPATALPAGFTGKCSATEPTGEAIRKAGKVEGAPSPTWVLPDGHRITPSGAESIIGDATHVGGFPVAITPIPSTHYAVIVDAGFGDHLARIVDLDAIGATGTPVVSSVVLPHANWGIAVLAGEVVGKHRVLVSGGAAGKVFALEVDDTSGALVAIEAKNVDLGTTPSSDGKSTDPYFSAGIAVTPDGTRLVATSAMSQDARVFSLEAATYGKEIARGALGKSDHFAVAIDPRDAKGEVAWVSLWGDSRVVAMDLATGKVTQSIPTAKNPEGLAFLDARWLVVADTDGDALTLIDRVTSSAVATVPIEKGAKLRGFGPSALTYDATTKRLYVAETVINAVEVFDVDLSGAAPVLVSRGRIPTSWWPTDVAIDPRGTGRVLVLDGRGHGTLAGTGTTFTPGEGEIAQVMRGTLQSIDVGSLDLAVTTKQVAGNAALSDTPGYPTVSCPTGAADFPIPLTNTAGPSALIKHVFLVIRENKNFDGVMGDFGGGVDGEPKNVLVPGQMETLYPNFRALGRAFTVLDNYYTDAEYSSQGHVWATYGRTTDFTERSWLIAASGQGRVLSGGVTEVGRAEEGSIFEWLLRNDVEYDILGEATGIPSPPKDRRNPVDARYPGFAQNIGLEDVTKSCYAAARARVLCDFHDFVYITLPNDHTFGGGGGRPTPETMIAVNDEATGELLDALSRSPFWKDSLVIVTEDDPQDGADHVDLHRTPILFAGPFVKKKYVAHGHYDVASLMKLLAHVRGLPYPNEVVARAPLPLEMFTSSPDFATTTFIPRTVPRACNSAGTKFHAEASMWDFEEIDEQVGLGVHVRQMLRATPTERGPLLVSGALAVDDDD